MPDVEFTNLFAVAVVALLAPLLLGFAPAAAGAGRRPGDRRRHRARPVRCSAGSSVDLPVQILALLGLAFLLFLAGLEIDVHRLRGRLLRLALLGLPRDAGARRGRRAAALDGGRLGATARCCSPSRCRPPRSAWSCRCSRTPAASTARLGQTTIAAASVADFAADRAAVPAVLRPSAAAPASRLVLLGAVRGCWSRVDRPWSRDRRPVACGSGDVLVRLQDTTAEIRVRAAVVLLVAFVALAEQFGLETILGAFLAGAVVGLVDRDSALAPALPDQARGDRLRLPDPGVLRHQRPPARPARPARQPGRAGSASRSSCSRCSWSRGLPALLYRRGRSAPGVRPRPGLLQATSLPFIVTATQIGVADRTARAPRPPPRWSAPACCPC